ncbi:MAG: chemotaxis protein CheW [Bacteroidales bacterium]|nr:chemotaxis protein CheW [Bacteroidales bacterium]
MEQETNKLNSYLSFKLGEETFAANVSKVLNILEMTKITKVPQAPDYMKGVINLRGSVLPLIDTRVKFGMEATEFTTNTCILVLEVNIDADPVHVGALVDSVQEVLEIDTAQIQPPPSLGSKYKSEFIEGVAKIDEEFIMILNMDLIFSIDDINVFKEVSEVKAELAE